MIALRRTVNSFDLFDTLLVRRALHPHRVFEDVERALGAIGFVQARISAERALRERGVNFDLDDIYLELVAGNTCSPEIAERLKSAEIEAEFDHAEPVRENLARVRENDLVVSDMYLPEDVLRRLLRHIGLRQFVHIVVSSAGKHFGTVWPQLGEDFLVLRHIGDNPHADVEVPSSHGIVTEAYAGTQPGPVEQLLASAGMFELAGIVRVLRLGCPHPAGSNEALLWQLYAQCNVPLLYLLAAAIRQALNTRGKHRVLFSARDCLFLSDAFSLLLPQTDARYIHVSRQVLWQDREAARAMLARTGLEDALVVDIASTGHSWYRFAEAVSMTVDFLALVRIDQHTPVLTSEQEIAASRFFRFDALVRNSEMRCYTNAIEVLNTAPYGSSTALFGAGQRILPEIAPRHELPATVPALLENAHAAGMLQLRKGRRRLIEEMPSSIPRNIVTSLIQTISDSPLLIELGRHYV